MGFFSITPAKEQTIAFVERMKKQFEDKGFCYYAVDQLDGREFIGFIGPSEQTYKGDFTPCIDIGWRIKWAEWNKGFASEGAKKCLEFALNKLSIEHVYTIAPKTNTKSEHIMAKTGLKKQYEFEHSLLANNERLKTCLLHKTN